MRVRERLDSRRRRMETRKLLKSNGFMAVWFAGRRLGCAARQRARRGRGSGPLIRDLRLRPGGLHPGRRGATRSGLGRRVPALEDRHRRAVRRRRPGEHQRQAEPLRREGHDADRIAQHAARLQVRVRPVRHRCRCGPDHVPAAPRLRRVGLDPRRPDQQPVHGRRRVPEHDRLLGPGGHGVLPQRADPLDALPGRATATSQSRSSGRATTSTRATCA